MSRCRALAAGLGHRTLYLYTGRGSGAERLYEQLGWRAVRYERYEGMDATVMRKSL